MSRRTGPFQCRRDCVAIFVFAELFDADVKGDVAIGGAIAIFPQRAANDRAFATLDVHRHVQCAIENAVAARRAAFRLCIMVDQQDGRAGCRQLTRDRDDAPHAFRIILFQSGERRRKRIDDDQDRAMLLQHAFESG